MPKSSLEKLQFAQLLLDKNIPYNEIQEKLKLKFGSGMSNTTLVKMQNFAESEDLKDRRIAELERELRFFKKLYFDLLETTQISLKHKEDS
ncbi:hypothetical protein NEF87_001386 [Candidatus Lokiarchaeum ossiferum]|uniref:Transposase n=1 Tax=Candidatus Lokiarchaeum ossiferum TaxID=2951803 RepID=A0ABY6HNL1_9ARCH|nr:hypothetical protein NEF87_001386 [Candidatus Lokiarchaeum sp. B-35]